MHAACKLACELAENFYGAARTRGSSSCLWDKYIFAFAVRRFFASLWVFLPGVKKDDSEIFPGVPIRGVRYFNGTGTAMYCKGELKNTIFKHGYLMKIIESFQKKTEYSINIYGALDVRLFPKKS